MCQIRPARHIRSEDAAKEPRGYLRGDTMFTSDNHRTARQTWRAQWLTRGMAALAGVACPVALAPAAGAVTVPSAAGAAPTDAAGPARAPTAYVVSNGGPLDDLFLGQWS